MNITQSKQAGMTVRPVAGQTVHPLCCAVRRRGRGADLQGGQAGQHVLAVPGDILAGVAREVPARGAAPRGHTTAGARQGSQAAGGQWRALGSS